MQIYPPGHALFMIRWLAVDEKLMRDTADKLVDLGLAKLGYDFLCVDGDPVPGVLK